jgi:TPR repeat protein
MINTFARITDLRRLGLGRLGLAVSCAVVLFALGPAAAGWKEVNTALETGKLAEALPHLRPLAEAGDPEAQYMLGYLLSGATGVEHDLMEAFKWYSTALALGQKNAAAARAMVGKKLGEFQAAEGLRRAKNWLQQFADGTDKGAKAGEAAGEDAADGGGVDAKDTVGQVPIPRDKPEKPS